MNRDNWIDVNEKPKVNNDDGFDTQHKISKSIWCWVKGHGGARGRYFYNSEKFVLDGMLGDWEVTHWQPLPSAPGEDKSEYDWEKVFDNAQTMHLQEFTNHYKHHSPKEVKE